MKNFLFIYFLFSFLIKTSLFSSVEKVSLQLESKHQFKFAGFYTALEKGYYEDLGLDVKIKEFKNGINIINDVIERKTTFGISSSSLVSEKSRNKPIVLITKPHIKNMALNYEMKNTSLGLYFGLYSYDLELFTSKEEIKNNLLKVKKFVKASIKGWEYALKNKKEIANLIINKGASVKIPEEKNYIIDFVYLFVFVTVLLFIVLFWNYQLRKKIVTELEKNYLQQDIMFKQNKKAELGNLIANISHQWRDSLTKVGYINLNLRARILQKKEITPDLINSSTLEIEKSLDFMSETMQNFLDYYKPSTVASKFVVHESIQSALNIIDTKIKDSNMSVEFTGDISVVINGVKNEWMQVWINLIMNSINISIERDITNPLIKITILEKSIILEDNCGKIDSKLLEQINNDDYKGIGIKMAKEIAIKHGGHMIIKNTENGASFSISYNK